MCLSLWIDGHSFKRFNEEKFPDKEYLYSSVQDGTTGDNGEKLDGHISGEDYLTCNKTWNEFNMKNIGDYHYHCLKKDVLLSADVFEKFIDSYLKFYKLDPCLYLSSPRLGWDATLKMTGVKLDTDMQLFLEKGLRGEIPYIAKRYCEENNKYMKNYDPTKLLLLMILNYDHQDSYRILKWTIYTTGRWVVIFLMVGLSG